MNALLYRTAEAGSIDNRTKSYLWMRMGQAGYRTHEPLEIAPETPELLVVHERTLEYDQQRIGAVICEPKGFADYRQGQQVLAGIRLVK